MKISGVITSLEDAEKIVLEIRKRRIPASCGLEPMRWEYYRGQLSADWHLKPGLVRNQATKDAVIEREMKVMTAFKNEMTSTNQLDKLYMHESPKAFQNEWGWLCQAQHYGVPTRLLDWTLRWEVGLYFAVDNAAFDNEDGAFWVLYMPQEEIFIDGGPDREYFDIDPTTIDKTIFINPSFYWHENFEEVTAEVRRARQHGKFSFQSHDECLTGLDEQEAFTKPYNSTYDMVIEKYIIPAEYKPQLRLDLIAKGYHGDFLYANDDAEINKVRDLCRAI